MKAAERATKRHPLARGFALGALITAAMAVFIIQNRVSVAMDWLWLDFDAPLWLALLVAFASGAVAGPLVGFGLRRISRERAKQRDAIRQLAGGRVPALDLTAEPVSTSTPEPTGIGSQTL